MRLLSVLFIALVVALAFVPDAGAACRSGRGLLSRVGARIGARIAHRHAQASATTTRSTTTVTRTTAVKGGGCANGKCAK